MIRYCIISLILLIISVDTMWGKKSKKNIRVVWMVVSIFVIISMVILYMPIFL